MSSFFGNGLKFLTMTTGAIEKEMREWFCIKDVLNHWKM